MSEDRERYYRDLVTAIDASGMSPGFARVSYDGKHGFEITLTIPQTVVDNYCAEVSAPTQGEEG